MKAGVLAVPDEHFGPVESFIETQAVDEHRELTACLEVRNTDTSGEYTIQEGRAAVQELGTTEKVSINKDETTIAVGEDIDVIKTKYTEFVLVPGEFVAVNNGKGTFAYSLISGQTKSATLKSAQIDLTSFADSYVGDSRPESAEPWQVGFYGNTGYAEKGIVYGDQVFDDADLGKIVQKLPKNQLGLRIDGEINMTATESGYVEVYNPSNYDSGEFATFIIDHILPHTELKAD